MSYDDNERLRNLFEQRKYLLEPESLRLMKAMQEAAKFIDPQTVEFAKQMENQIRLMQPAIEQIKLTFKTISFPDQSEIQRFKAISEMMSGLRKWSDEAQKLRVIGESMKMSAIPTIGFIAEDFQRAVDTIDQYKIYSESFSSQLFNYLGRLEVAKHEDEKSELFEELYQFLEESFQRLRKNRISLEGYLSIILAVILFIYSQHSSYESEERIKSDIEKGDENVISELQSSEERLNDKLSDIEKRILAEIEEHCDLEDNDKYFVITKKVNLREGPSTEDNIIAVLQPNMTVELIQKSGEWMNIDTFDFINLQQRMGWVHQDYLHPLNE